MSTAVRDAGIDLHGKEAGDTVGPALIGDANDQTHQIASLPRQPAPRGRSKKRKASARAGTKTVPPREMIRLGDRIEQGSERLTQSLSMRLSTENKAREISLDEAGLEASSSGGYRSVRGTHGAHEGRWYYEVCVEALGHAGAVRMGWATTALDLHTPVGTDASSYAYRSQEGSKVHGAKREVYATAFGEGAVVGCLIHLPHGGRRLEKGLDDVVKYRGNYYFVEEDGARPPPKPLEGSYVEFFLHGVSQGKAYSDLLEGCYYPVVSLYTSAEQEAPARVRVNFGASPFANPLPLDARPLADLPETLINMCHRKK
jgi:hypothetical protein